MLLDRYIPFRFASSTQRLSLNTLKLINDMDASHSMLMFMNPSLVSFIPCSPTRRGVPACEVFRFTASAFGSFTTGELGMTGLLWMLVLGDTALRLKRFESRSSSRRRFRLKSPNDEIWDAATGVEAREFRSNGLANSVVEPNAVDGVISIAESSSDIDDAAVCRSDGGGVRYRSSNEFQNSGPPEFRFACRLKLDSVGIGSPDFSP